MFGFLQVRSCKMSSWKKKRSWDRLTNVIQIGIHDYYKIFNLSVVSLIPYNFSCLYCGLLSSIRWKWVSLLFKNPKFRLNVVYFFEYSLIQNGLSFRVLFLITEDNYKHFWFYSEGSQAIVSFFGVADCDRIHSHFEN